MGYVRFLLALSIIFGHIPISNKFFFGAPMALHLFFMISGYSITYVLTEKYRNGKKVKLKDYYTSRLLRIYPLYILVLFSSIIFEIYRYCQGNVTSTVGLFIRYAHNIPFILGVIASNIIIIGQDLFIFLGFNLSNSQLFFTNSFSVSPYRIDSLLFIPQSWALALELYFYLIAPWLVKRRTYFLLVLGISSFMLRIILTIEGLPFEPWSYRFFPTELVFFLLGMLSYRWRYTLNNVINHVHKILLFIFIIVIIILFRTLPYIELYGYQLFEWLFIIVFVLVLPFLFVYRHRDRINTLLSELSYPMYLTQLLFSAIVVKLHFPDPYHGIVTIFVTIAGSYGISKVMKPLRNIWINKNVLEIKMHR
jgi:peptidoglycan/LPS O-acetylase OafA/YrhL